MSAFAPRSFPRTAEDWSELWHNKQQARSMEHGAAYWDARSRTYESKDSPGSYTAHFLEYAALAPGDAVFDMGCGTGNLTIPLARAGHQVCAADFSSGMLAKLEEAVCAEGLQDRVRIVQLAWDDDWEAAGIHEGAFDACFASRSIATEDLLGALCKLDGAARKRCCITLPYSTSPRIVDRMIADVGFAVHPSYDSSYAIAMVSALGQLPTLTYIPTTRTDTFESTEAALERYLDMARAYEADAQQHLPGDELRSRVSAWLDANLVPAADDSHLLTLKEQRTSFWAFIAWTKGPAA